MKKSLALIALSIIFLGCATGNSVKAGDVVELDYTGYFGDGLVFDTSNESVAVSPDYPKSKLFVQRQFYPELMFTVGVGQTLPAIDNTVIGMKIGETRRVPMFFKDVFGNLVRPIEKEVFGEGANLSVGDVVEDNLGITGQIVLIRDDDVVVKFSDPHEEELVWFNVTLLRIGRG